MFELFTIKNSETDLVTKASAHAIQEKDEEAAIQLFLETIRDNRKIISDLREVSRKSIQQLCREAGIKNELRRARIQEDMESRWEQILARTVREYLRDRRREAVTAPDKAVGGVTIEFVSS